jgi:hypothetical protein
MEQVDFLDLQERRRWKTLQTLHTDKHPSLSSDGLCLVFQITSRFIQSRAQKGERDPQPTRGERPQETISVLRTDPEPRVIMKASSIGKFCFLRNTELTDLRLTI